MPTKTVLVQKYGGSSVSTVEKIQEIAERIVARHRAGHSVVVVVSAMGDTTDALLKQAHCMSANPNRRELDMLLTVGERISMSLLAMAIRELGEEAVSLTGSQSGIITTASHTNARIMEVRPFRVQDELEQGRIVIVAGYQGVSYKREITTLGRGGSDTTAVALAAALDAEACEIYSDVDGVFSADPRIAEDARRIDTIGYEEMQEMAAAGARILNTTAVEFAKQKGIAIYARKSAATSTGTVVRRDAPKSFSGVRGIAHETNILIVEKSKVDHADLQSLLAQLETADFAPKLISWTVQSLCLVFPNDDLIRKESLNAVINAALGQGCLFEGRGTVSLIGEGLSHNLELSNQAARALKDISIHGMSTSRFRISWILDASDVEDATRRLHRAFDLASPS